MKVLKKLACVVLVSSLALTGCVVDRDHAHEQSGTLTGAVAGGLLGSTLGGGVGRGVATMVGAMVGGAVGSSVGQSMDDQAKDRAERAYVKAMKRNHQTHWQHNEYSGDIMPAQPTFFMDGRACKRLTMTVYVGKHVDKINGTACDYGKDGWLIVEKQHLRINQPTAKPMHFHRHDNFLGHPQPKDCHCHCHGHQ